LSDPDLLALGGSNSLIVRVEEKVAAVANAVGERALKVRIGVHPNPVEIFDDVTVAGIDIDLPCVDVTELGARKAGSSNGI
nr:hypothetical protein [Tanacetum cinerariifolium]